MIAPAIGGFTAVLIEVPIVIIASWLVAKRLLRKQDFGNSECLIMGGLAFALLMLAEAGLARMMYGQSVIDWAMTVMTPTGLIGFSGQVIFALTPLVARRSAQLDA